MPKSTIHTEVIHVSIHRLCAAHRLSHQHPDHLPPLPAVEPAQAGALGRRKRLRRAGGRPGGAAGRRGLRRGAAAGAAIFCLTYGRNVLAGDPAGARPAPAQRPRPRALCRRAGHPAGGAGHGPRTGQDVCAQNLPAVVDWLGEQVLPLARQGGVTVAIENCPAVGNIATSPAMWHALFDVALRCPNLTLGFDPSHLVWQFVDPYAALRDYAATRCVTSTSRTPMIDRARLAVEGIDGEGWWRYTLPGWGELNWAALIAGVAAAPAIRGLSQHRARGRALGSQRRAGAPVTALEQRALPAPLPGRTGRNPARRSSRAGFSRKAG
jgi:sugar phosphate isomerase/epimerase